MNSTVLLVVAKAPEPGRAKTRLCPAVSAEVAAELAAASLLDTLDAACQVPAARVFVAFTGDLDRAARRIEVAQALTRVTVLAQRGAGLGARLAAAHEEVAAVTAAPVLQIGMDTPQVDPTLLVRCAAPLHRAGGPEAVLGPADDGGWWALGLRDPRQAALLRTVAMSREDTGARTRHALRAARLTVETLPRLADVDTIDDAYAVATRVPDSQFATTLARRTAPT